MRDGYRIIDTDTHVGPSAEVLEKYASPSLRARWHELLPYYQKVTEGHHLSIKPMPYKRRMGEPVTGPESATDGGTIPLRGKVNPMHVVPAEPQVQNENAAGRLRDMDKEGRDVDLIIPATFATAASALDIELALELYGAYHRYLSDYCSADTSRLKAAIVVTGADPEWSAREIKHLAAEPWVAAVTVVLPEGLPLDEPSLHPIWRALDDADLPILHHSFFYEPPYFPGYRDIWGNIAVARAAAHPWGAQRLVAYLMLSGLLDEYPRLRMGFAECSAGWVPGWLVRLKGQAELMHTSLPPRRQDPLEYAAAGRLFCGIELYEGEAMAKAIVDVAGDGVLMYQSDYPHPGCQFPDSPATVLSWTGLGDAVMRKLMSENAERFLRLV